MRFPGFENICPAVVTSRGIIWHADDSEGVACCLKAIPPKAREIARRFAEIGACGIQDVIEGDCGRVALKMTILPGVPLPYAEADDTVAVLRSVCAQLVNLHDAGLYHGDVSAMNIMVEGNQVTLIDPEFDSRWGTDRYAPPGEKPGMAADVWALGALLGEYGAEREIVEAAQRPQRSRVDSRALLAMLQTRESIPFKPDFLRLTHPVSHRGNPRPLLVLPKHRDARRSVESEVCGLATTMPRSRKGGKALPILALLALILLLFPPVGELFTNRSGLGNSNNVGQDTDSERQELQELLNKRDRALNNGDLDGLLALCEPGSPMETSERKLLAEIGRRGLEVSELDTEVRSATAREDGWIKAEIVQGAYRSCSQGRCSEIEQQQSRWKLFRISDKGRFVETIEAEGI